MKKIIAALFLGMFLYPLNMVADHYEMKKGDENPNIPIKAPARYHIGVSVDEETGDFFVCPNYNISGLQITISRNGMTYLNTTVSLVAGQVYTDCLDFLDEGSYTLTLSTSDGVISTYEVIVEDDW